MARYFVLTAAHATLSLSPRARERPPPTHTVRRVHDRRVERHPPFARFRATRTFVTRSPTCDPLSARRTSPRSPPWCPSRTTVSSRPPEARTDRRDSVDSSLDAGRATRARMRLRTRARARATPCIGAPRGVCVCVCVCVCTGRSPRSDRDDRASGDDDARDDREAIRRWRRRRRRRGSPSARSSMI